MALAALARTKAAPAALAALLGRLSKARNAAGHPDVALEADIAAVLGQRNSGKYEYGAEQHDRAEQRNSEQYGYSAEQYEYGA